MDTPAIVQALIAEPPDLAIIQVARPETIPAPGPTESTPGATPWYALALRGHRLRLAPTGQLLAPALLADRIAPHAYQLRVVEAVLNEKRPAAILADEVGLGKTIEAGLILKELLLRGLAASALIIAPKALLTQWQDELRERFDETFVVAGEPGFTGYQTDERVICSFQQFVRGFDRIGARMWDCLIVDEAHLLANPDSKRRRFVGETRARWRLLLTATPVQNKLTDLYSLVDLVRPGQLGTERQFVQEYAADPATCRAVVPARAPELRAVARAVMCRTRRDETAIAFATRTVETHRIAPDDPESALIGDVTAYLRALYRRSQAAESRGPAARRANATTTVARGRDVRTADARTTDASGENPGGHQRDQHGRSERMVRAAALSRGAVIREIIALQQSLSSSPWAIAASLRARAAKHPDESASLVELAARAESLRGAKERLLFQALQRFAPAEPILIFTLRLETARHLRDAIRQGGSTAECYVGALSQDERRDVVDRFNRGELRALVATDAGAEGLNLQERCHTVFNYDLHWNPMKMEQRIGRVHRLGQRHPVLVANFALADTIDEYVLDLLYQKIDLFTLTIGALETILADIQEGEMDVEERILDILLRDEESPGIRDGINQLGEDFERVRLARRQAESLTTDLLG